MEPTTSNNSSNTKQITPIEKTFWQKTKTKVMKYILIILALILVALAYFTFGNFSEGSRAGTLIKLSKKGYVFKTWEGELSQTMFIGDQGAAAANSNLWDFSVTDSDTSLINTLNIALLNGKRIKLDYKQKYVVFPWQGDTKYFITKAELMK